MTAGQTLVLTCIITVDWSIQVQFDSKNNTYMCVPPCTCTLYRSCTIMYVSSNCEDFLSISQMFIIIHKVNMSSFLESCSSCEEVQWVGVFTHTYLSCHKLKNSDFMHFPNFIILHIAWFMDIFEVWQWMQKAREGMQKKYISDSFRQYFCGGRRQSFFYILGGKKV